MMSKFAARRRGFTLIELLIVIVVIAILALIVIPKLMGASRKAKDSTLKANLQILRNAIEMYNADLGIYPPTLADLYTAPADPALVDSYKGPYVKSEGAIVSNPAIPIPINPYTTLATAEEHWDYDAATGNCKPLAAAVPALDAEGEDYQLY